MFKCNFLISRQNFLHSAIWDSFFFQRCVCVGGVIVCLFVAVLGY